MKRASRGLGSGLEALLPGDSQQSIRQVRVERISPNTRQPRLHFDEAALEELTASIREHGIIQPLIVSERADGYELVAGERRWRAAQRAGIELVPVIVRETTPQQLLELAIIENVQRADLNPIEEAQAYQALKNEFGLSDDQIAQRVGKNNRVTVANTRRLLHLPAAAQEVLASGQISAGHGRALLKIKDAAQQSEALTAVLRDDLNVREAERLGEMIGTQGFSCAQALRQLRPTPGALSNGQNGNSAPSQDGASRVRSAASLSDEDREAVRLFEEALGTPVAIQRTNQDVRVVITFHSDEALNQFYEQVSRT